jgi:hypothetical protein
MVIAGTKNKKTHGAIENKGERLEVPISRIFMLPGKTHRNNPFTVRKTAMTIYPVSAPKKPG